MGLLYSKFKIFHFQEKLDSLNKPLDIVAPLHVRIKPTNVCAHNCWYCAYRSDNYQLGESINLKEYIPKEKMQEIICDLSGMKVKSVTFSGGGDPFYYPYFSDTIKQLINTDIKFAALTNGAGLRNEVAELFSKYGTWLRVSIDGWDDKSYSKYRGIKEGAFTKVLKNLENFQLLGGSCYLGVSIIVDKDNSNHIYDMIKTFNSIGVSSVKVSACLISDDVNEINKYHRPHLESVKEQIDKAGEEFSSEQFEINDSFYEIRTRYQKEYNWCPFCQIVPVIGADMNVYSCHDKAYTDKGLLGSIESQSFEKMWYTDKNKYFMINPSRDCDHHCMMNQQNINILEYLEIDDNHMEFI